MMMITHLNDWLANKRVEVRHQFAVDVRHVQVLRDDGDEAHGAVPDPQVRVTQERSYGRSRGTNDIRGVCRFSLPPHLDAILHLQPNT